MADPFVYSIDISECDGNWRNLERGRHRQSLERREAVDVARGIFEGWILDNPHHMAGGERMMVCEDASEFPPESQSHVRIQVYRGTPDAHEGTPAAAAFLIDLPHE